MPPQTRKMAKRKPKDRLQTLLEELSWYDPDEWNLTEEEQTLLKEFYDSLHRLMQLRARNAKPGTQVGMVTFRKKPKGA